MEEAKQQETIANVFWREMRLLVEGWGRIEQFRLCPADWDEVIAATSTIRRGPWSLTPPLDVDGLCPDPMLLGYPLVVDPDAPPLSDEQG